MITSKLQAIGATAKAGVIGRVKGDFRCWETSVLKIFFQLGEISTTNRGKDGNGQAGIYNHEIHEMREPKATKGTKREKGI